MLCPKHEIELTLLRSEPRRNVYTCSEGHPVFEFLDKETVKQNLALLRADVKPSVKPVKLSNIVRR